MLAQVGIVLIVTGLALVPTILSFTIVPCSLISQPYLCRLLPSTRLHSHRDVIFLSTVGLGHVIPTIPLVRSLSLRNYTVHYFADATGPKGLDYVTRGTTLGDAVVEAGGKLKTYNNDVGLQENEVR